MHGVPRLVKSDSYLVKLLWLVMISFSTSYGSLSIYRTCVDYLNYAVIVQTQEVKQSSMVFPAIVYCFESHLTMLDLSMLEFTFNNVKVDAGYFDYFDTTHGFLSSCVRFNGFKTDSSR